MKKIDILMATYNGEKYLREQIESILKQTYTNFRLIISDDCSTDNTRQILDEYKNRDPRIEIYYQPQNLKNTKNFEFLLGKVENELYALADQDDIWLPNKIEKSVEQLEKEQADLVFCDLIVVDENGNELKKSFWKEKGFTKKIKKDKKYRGLRLNNYITGCTIVGKKELLKEILPMPENAKYLIHDYWIAIVTSLKGKITYIKETLIKYRQHGNNQVGYRMKSREKNSLDEIRDMFIDVKIELFSIYCNNSRLFSQKEQDINRRALDYYRKMKDVKMINLKNWMLFYKLYRYENFLYFVANFIIINIPGLAKLLYKRR